MVRHSMRVRPDEEAAQVAHDADFYSKAPMDMDMRDVRAMQALIESKLLAKACELKG